MDPTPRAIVYFDGVCNLCNGFVDFLIRHDRKRVLRYAPQQGSTFTAFATRHRETKGVDTMIAAVGPAEKTYLKSDATLMAVGQLPWPWSWAPALRIVPRFLRNWAYDAIAANRYRLFGKRETCRLPTPAERALFLD